MTCTPVMASRAEGEKRGRASSDEDRADVTVRRMRNATWASGRAGKRKRRGKGSTQRRRDQRAHGRSGSSSEQSGSESDEGQSGADGAEEAPCQRIGCRLVRTQHAALEQQVEELAERKEDAGREIEELEKKLEEGKQNAERMFEVREMIEWADGIGEENEFSVSGRERVCVSSGLDGKGSWGRGGSGVSVGVATCLVRRECCGGMLWRYAKVWWLRPRKLVGRWLIGTN